jgi:cobalt-zinc-cadmium efflux system membrane fusion protein
MMSRLFINRHGAAWLEHSPRVVLAFGGVGLAVLVTILALRGGELATRATTAATDARLPADATALSLDAQRLAGIDVAPARVVTAAATVDAVGLLALDETRTARIGSMVEGIVVKTHAEVGDRVRRGALLAELHSHRVHDAWAAYRKAAADRRRLETELAYAGDAEQRARRLYTDKAVSAQDVARAEADRIAAQEQLDVARTEVRRSEEELEHLGVTNQDDPTGERGEFIPSRSPIAGVVLERSISAGTGVTPGLPMFVVSDLSSLWALVEVDERQLAQVRVGMRVALRVAAYPEESFGGTVASVGDTVNDRTRRVPVRCAVPNADGRLKPQMFATVTLESDQPRRVVVVPGAAVQEMAGRTVVFVRRGDGRFERREITAGPERNGLVEIRAGVREGDLVATAGSFLIKAHLLDATDSEQ